MTRRIPERPETPPLARKKESDLTDFSEQDTAAGKPAATPKLSARDKAAVTDEAARAIIDAEVSARDSKTEKLRALRLQREARDAANPPPAKKPAAARPRKARS